MKTVITYGTFDLFHVGHIRLLKRLKELGGRLIVGISSDEFNKVKGKISFYSYEERAEIVSSCKYVDEVFPENDWDQKRGDIIRYDADIFSIGDDWQGKFDNLKDICEVIYLSRTADISTTEIKCALSKIDYKELDRVEKSLHEVISIVRSLSDR
ncbi:adenylyltransferase/cytidyltransferase family protein [Pseudoalteromonas sp. NGC95]|uniref:adenylyltransferase/cytidyltransferase family protein n=1 Tax=Pseudoalteromonas sp. NGC95 TaxID=2792051 RepID=UPI0018CEEE51|nr:adenylyltransferase/cytidyltransferase family protein [Pseudoalteromonas sp. NGC95]